MHCNICWRPEGQGMKDCPGCSNLPNVLETEGTLVIQPKPAPQFLTARELAKALAQLPPNLADALVLCNGKPAYELRLELGTGDGSTNAVNVRFFELGLL